MIIAAIISEYNPFHNGHFAHIKATKELTGCDCIIAVMSGNFVQRGEPAIFDKYFRARAAILGGADMVIELPAIAAISNADVFGGTAVRILNDIKEIKYLSFGSESGNLDELTQLSRILSNESDNISRKIQKNLDEGLSFPSSRSRAIKEVMGERYFDMLSSPNNILALEYLRHIDSTKSHIKPVTIKRVGAAYHDADYNKNIPSATALRQALYECNNDAVLKGVPEQIAVDYIKAYKPIDKYARLYDLIRYKLLNTDPDELNDIADITEGLEYRILKAAQEPDYKAFLDKVKTKRYTMAKIKRVLLNILFDIKKRDIQKIKTAPLYKNVLAVKKEKINLLSLLGAHRITRKQEYDSIKNKSTLSLISKNILADDIYSVITSDAAGQFFTQGLLII